MALDRHQAAHQVGHLGDGAVALANGAHVTGRAVNIHPEAVALAPEIVVARDHRFAGRGVGHLRLVAVEADVAGQAGFEAIAHEQLRSARRAGDQTGR